jgi:hypothetical protein
MSECYRLPPPNRYSTSTSIGPPVSPRSLRTSSPRPIGRGRGNRISVRKLENKDKPSRAARCVLRRLLRKRGGPGHRGLVGDGGQDLLSPGWGP